MTTLTMRYHFHGIRLSRGYPMYQFVIIEKLLSESIIIEPNGHNADLAAYRNCQSAADKLRRWAVLAEEDIQTVLDRWSQELRGAVHP